MGSRFCVIAAVLVALGLVLAEGAAGDTGRLAGKVHLGVALPRTEYLPGDLVECYTCFDNVSDVTLTFCRPGGMNLSDLWGVDVRLFDRAKTQLRSWFGYAEFMPSELDRTPLTLGPGDKYCMLESAPRLFTRDSNYPPGRYGLQVRFYYYDESMPDFAGSGDVPNLERRWKENHVRYLDSSLVWFGVRAEQGMAGIPTLRVNGREITDARPLRVDGLVYVDQRGLAAAGVQANSRGEEIVARRGEREVTLPLGKWDPKRDKQRPALPGSVGAIYLPLRQVATALGLRVNWDPARQVADVRS